MSDDTYLFPEDRGVLQPADAPHATIFGSKFRVAGQSVVGCSGEAVAEAVGDQLREDRCRVFPDETDCSLLRPGETVTDRFFAKFENFKRKKEGEDPAVMSTPRSTPSVFEPYLREHAENRASVPMLSRLADSGVITDSPAYRYQAYAAPGWYMDPGRDRWTLILWTSPWRTFQEAVVALNVTPDGVVPEQLYVAPGDNVYRLPSVTFGGGDTDDALKAARRWVEFEIGRARNSSAVIWGDNDTSDRILQTVHASASYKERPLETYFLETQIGGLSFLRGR